MAFDFIHSKITGQAIGAFTVTSGSVEYTGYSGNISGIVTTADAPLTFSSGSLIVRNGLIIGVGNLTSSAVVF